MRYALLLGFLIAIPALAQPDRVLTLGWNRTPAQALPADAGAAGLWHQLQKLRTTASVLHVVAHPDDEHGGALARWSRGEGARTAQLTLNRGEGGANAIGPELFDALGLVRTEELLIAHAYYGSDDLYFTTAADYGFSKTLDEALGNWGREEVLRDMVRVIRLNRPLVLHSRFHGSERDGHGHHQAAGVLTQEAYEAAGDPNRFPEQIAEGLRPWQPLKLYRGGVRDGEPHHVVLDANAYAPHLGATYRNFASQGLAYQRSQLSGRYREVYGPQLRHYERLASQVDSERRPTPEREASIFGGIDTSLPGLFALFGETPPAGALDALAAAADHVDAAVAAFNVPNPAAVAPGLAQGLRHVRAVAQALPPDSEVRFHLEVKEGQFEDAIHTALGLDLDALAVPTGTEASESWWSPLPTMPPAVPGQALDVQLSLVNPSPVQVVPDQIYLEGRWQGAEPAILELADVALRPLADGDRLFLPMPVEIPADARLARRPYARASLAESRYSVRDSATLHLPNPPPALSAVVRYRVAGVPLTLRRPVQRRETNLPYGYRIEELKVLPAVAVNVEPATQVIPLAQAGEPLSVEAEVVGNRPDGVRGMVRLEVPAGWAVEPAQHAFALGQAGQRERFRFAVTPAELAADAYPIRAVAEVDGEAFSEGYQTIAHRDLATQYLFRDAVTTVRGVDVEPVPGLAVGYVMGVGDEVPAAIRQLGATVALLDADALAGDLSGYDAVVVGTRAYAVRPDLATYNERLLDYARAGGTVIVLYQTPEFEPERQAPFPASLGQRPEETSEEDAPVTLLAPEHPVLAAPNRITERDFDGWIEQRGSKFFRTWDDAYTPLVETADTGQAPQRGVWLVADVGEGHYSYVALALHRQLPYAVPGAYRLLANLLALGR